jgi:uncharacterized cupin superfamily protein
MTIDRLRSTRLFVEKGIIPFQRSANMKRKWIVLLMATALAGCNTTPGDPAVEETRAALSGVGIDTYSVGTPVDDSSFVDVTAQMTALGGTLLSGNPTLKIRFDAPPDGVTAHGVFEQLGQATIRIVFPFDEHIQVINGLLRITDAAGTTFSFAPGDSYFIAQGSVVTWQVLTPTFQKSFFDYTHPAH